MPPPTARRLWSIGLLLFLVACAAACGGGSEQATVVASPTPQRSGIAELDGFLDAIRTRDAAGLHDAVVFVPQMCLSNPQPTPSGAARLCLDAI